MAPNIGIRRSATSSKRPIVSTRAESLTRVSAVRPTTQKKTSVPYPAAAPNRGASRRVRQHRLGGPAAIRRARNVRHREEPEQHNGQQGQSPVARQIVRHDCRDPHEGEACVGPFLQGWRRWQEQHNCSGQLADARECVCRQIRILWGLFTCRTPTRAARRIAHR